jgi:hypothetical protein
VREQGERRSRNGGAAVIRPAEYAAVLAPPLLCAAVWAWNAWRSERRSRRLARELARRGRP